MRTTTTSVEVCPHGRPVDGGCWWRGIPPCEDCESEEWVRTRKTTIIGVSLIAALIFIPLIMLLCGTFW